MFGHLTLFWKLYIVPMLRELTSLSFNINYDTLILSSVSEADLVTGGPAYKLSPSLLLGSHIQTMGEPVVTDWHTVITHHVGTASMWAFFEFDTFHTSE